MTAASRTGGRWRKSSHSGGNGNTDCVEVAFSPVVVGVRDSKNVEGSMLVFGPSAWRAFAAGVSARS